MKKQTKEKLPDPLQMPLRLDPAEVVALNELQQYLNEKTRTGAIKAVIRRYKTVYENLQQSLQIQTDQRSKMVQLKNYFNTMKDAESEINKILNLK